MKINDMQEVIAVQTERIGKGLGVLQELREHLALPKFKGEGNDWIATGDLHRWIERLQDAMLSNDVVRIGSSVVSYDSESRYSGVRGKVVGFKHHEGCLRYQIKVECRFTGAAESIERDEVVVIPPVNGTLRVMGGRCDGVALAW